MAASMAAYDSAMSAQAGMSMPAGYDTMQPGFAGQPPAYGAQYGAQYGQAQAVPYGSGSPGATAAYGSGQATFHDYRGSSSGMTPYAPANAPASSGGAAPASYGGYASYGGAGDTAAQYAPPAPTGAQYGGYGAPGAQYGGQSLGAPQYAGAAPSQGSFGATPPGSFGAGGFSGGAYQFPSGAAPGFPPQDGFPGAGAPGLPPSGSFVATGGFDTGLPGAGPMGQFSNPFLAAMYSTLNGQTDPKNWPQFDVPTVPLAAAAREDARFNSASRAFDRGPERGEDTADSDRKKILSPEEKETKKKRGVKKEKEETGGGFWFWTCS